MTDEIAALLAAGVRATMPFMVGLRRELHALPELRYQETRTAARLAEGLAGLGLRLRTGLAGTGLVAVLEPPGCRPDAPTVALRADMDALPIDEPEGLPFRSRTPGVMHACGHDAHSAVVAGLARVLAPLADRLPGRVVLVFQPAEEGGLGAQAMIEAGALADPRVDAILGFHVFPALPTGEVSIYRGPSHASADTFTLRFVGKGGHAGYPHLCRDPLGPACEWVVALRALVAREVDPLDAAVITIGAVLGGDAPNVTPESAEVRGTLRCLDETVRARLKARLVASAEGLAAAHRIGVEVRFDPGCPANLNHPGLAGLLGAEAAAVLGAPAVKALPPAMGAEDFACYTRVIPGAMFRLGCSPPGAPRGASLHSPRFFLDEACMEHAALVLARTAWTLLARGPATICGAGAP